MAPGYLSDLFFQMDIHIFEPQGISFLETESTFMTNELADALTVSQNQTKVGLPQWVGEGTEGPVFRLPCEPGSPESGTIGQTLSAGGLLRSLCPR